MLKIGYIVARIDFAPQLFPCQHRIKVPARRCCLFVEFFRLLRVARCGATAYQPVEPGRAFLQFFGHMRDNGGQLVPTSGAQGGSGVPLDLVVGQLAAVGNLAVIVQGGRHIEALRLIMPQYAPRETALFEA